MAEWLIDLLAQCCPTAEEARRVLETEAEAEDEAPDEEDGR